MKIVYTARNVTEARFVCDLLEGENIMVTLVGEGLSGIAGEVPIDQTWPRVQVEDADAERAQSIVDEFVEKRTPAEGESWTCDGCGETHEPQFGECWSCGKARAEA